MDGMFSFSGKPVPVPYHPHSKESNLKIPKIHINNKIKINNKKENKITLVECKCQWVFLEIWLLKEIICFVDRYKLQGICCGRAIHKTANSTVSSEKRSPLNLKLCCNSFWILLPTPQGTSELLTNFRVYTQASKYGFISLILRIFFHPVFWIPAGWWYIMDFLSTTSRMKYFFYPLCKELTKEWSVNIFCY